MRKIYLPLLSAFVTMSCVLQIFSPSATPTPASTSTNTLTPQPTFTPVTPSPTFTFTPTLIGVRTVTATPEATQILVDTVTPFNLLTYTPPTPTEIFNLQGFVFVNISVPQFYKGRDCNPSFVKITAQAGLSNTAHVLLFARFKSLKSDTASKWTSIEMQTIGGGTYVHDLYTDEMKEDEIFYLDNWVEYQIVATNSAGTEIGRTDIFKEKVKSLVCVPPTATIKP